MRFTGVGSAWGSVAGDDDTGMGSLLTIYFLATFAFAKFESTIALLGQVVFSARFPRELSAVRLFRLILVLAQGGVRSMSKRMSATSIGLSGSLMLFLECWSGRFGAVGISPGSLCLVGYFGGWLRVLDDIVAQSLISMRSRSDEQGGILGLNHHCRRWRGFSGSDPGNIAFGISPTLPYAISAGLMAFVFFHYSRLLRREIKPVA